MAIKLDMMQTLALASVVLFIGHGIQQRIDFLKRYSIPAAVIGGFLFATLSLILRVNGWATFEFTTTLQAPLMIAFFTTIGLGASLGLLKIGGPQILIFFLISSVLCVLQDVLGVGIAKAVGVHPYLGLIAGSITLVGGHGTGAAFGNLMETQYGFAGAVPLAMAAATFGVVSGGLIGGPITTALIKRYNPPKRAANISPEAKAAVAEYQSLDTAIDIEPAGEAATAYSLLKMISIVLVAMWLGGLLSLWMGRYMTLPAYIGAMVVALIMRNVFDATKLIKISQRTVDDVGTIALSLFLAMALMTLRLWELKDLALPMLLILTAQVLLMAAFAYWVTFRLMGADYDAAVMAGGQCGFGLGATSNAVATMEAIVQVHGPAPRAFLVVPMVGAFFIDLVNSIIITGFMNWL
jgi:ESS family glutamate:Na+ symporter